MFQIFCINIIYCVEITMLKDFFCIKINIHVNAKKKIEAYLHYNEPTVLNE